MKNVWCVRADFGTYAEAFLKGRYVAIGWRIGGTDLSRVKSREELYPLYRETHPEDKSNLVVGIQVGQIARFLLEMMAGDYVITPAADSEWLCYGEVAPDPSYFHVVEDSACPYPHRRRVEWSKAKLKRGDLSVPFQNTLHSSLTVFSISQREEFYAAIKRVDLLPVPTTSLYDAHRVVLEHVLRLDDKEFEILVAHLLTALGFEGSEATGRPGDGGVDATGELNIANLAKVKIFVQAKRYKIGSRVSTSAVRQLRQAIPLGGQGAFITTAEFQRAASDIALEPGFPRIGLVNGHQLVDLLVEHWDDIPAEFQERLGLKRGLVRS